LSLAAAGLLAAAPAFPSGFQIMTQGPRATGMGLAFTAVADDPSAIFYNPAGIGFQDHFSVEMGAGFITKLTGDFHGDNPFPGIGANGDQHKTTFVTPNFYAVIPLTQDVKLGLGVFSEYGLGFRWNDPAPTYPWPGRFVSDNAVIQSVDLNPVLAWRLTPEFSIAGGASYRLSRVQLERNNGTFDPLSNAVEDTARVKLNSSIWDNHGWGWNAALLFKPAQSFSIGASYRSKIGIDYTGDANFTQILTGNPLIDALVASRLPQGPQAVTTHIEFPGSLNLGMAFVIAKNTTLSLEADWTEWSKFSQLNINFVNPAIPGLDRTTNWDDSWAYRFGVEQKFGNWAVRSGYYRDKTPQPASDVGPILADNDRDGFTIGFGYDVPKWGFNIADLYLKVKDRTINTAPNTDGFYGRYSESINIAIASFRFSF
jgi:long-chain fatty acid transport protein